MKLAFIGLGTMGAPMALRLALAGFDLAVYDISSKACARFDAVSNCRVASSPADAAQGATAIITMLPESRHVRDAIFGSQSAIETLRPGTIVIDMSTGSVPALLDLASDLAAHEVRLMDAPVGRSPKEAQAGQLLVMAGGSKEDIAEVSCVLECLGQEVIHAGPLGAGLKLKLVNNYMSMVGMVMTAEALNLARMLDLDLTQTVHVLQSTPAGRGQINTNFPKKVLKGDVSPDFPLRLGLKDIGLGLALAQSAGAPTPLGSAAQQIFALSFPWGRAEQDCTAMLHLYGDLSGPSSQTMSGSKRE
ncbi:NAD(P)-dependent oxidoreductase [Pelagibius sp. Alg239-R121]|uniref:NAD(P)-dependent oxidoreductase n=1 Tax=Pelagibius sp. Alg239-R121 TaxID=2993448 RepID=UPI0024A7A20C|nr:NAD(P)-dependent oxidoreductase [Pelagibius sp. Alg239-R121]